MRHCNWVRFIQTTSNSDEVNMVARKVNDRPVFEIVRPIPSNGETQGLLHRRPQGAGQKLACESRAGEQLAQPEVHWLIDNQPGRIFGRRVDEHATGSCRYTGELLSRQRQVRAHVSHRQVLGFISPLETSTTDRKYPGLLRCRQDYFKYASLTSKRGNVFLFSTPLFCLYVTRIHTSLYIHAIETVPIQNNVLHFL